MSWECSECGEQLVCVRPPAVCRNCGTAGVTYVKSDDSELDREPSYLRAAWLRAGMQLGCARVD
ncbi:MAG: hypothetical protein AB7P03_30805 [Kofleriaceae bacterium]